MDDLNWRTFQTRAAMVSSCSSMDGQATEKEKLEEEKNELCGFCRGSMPWLDRFETSSLGGCLHGVGNSDHSICRQGLGVYVAKVEGEGEGGKGEEQEEGGDRQRHLRRVFRAPRNPIY